MGTKESLGKTNILRPPEATLAEFKAIEEPESDVESAASAVDKCCKRKPDPNSQIILIVEAGLMHG